ncbi:MAG TPA: hypothetical protein VKA48_10780 [Gammaproteobacteria bacterium]|nr:hypothetical protein [Gammaproteobacteria bacterium]
MIRLLIGRRRRQLAQRLALRRRYYRPADAHMRAIHLERRNQMALAAYYQRKREAQGC